MRCGLLGERLGHSYSPQIHRCLGEYSYDLFEVSPENLENFLKSGTWDAINVTIPYKKAVMEYCAQIAPEAKRIGAVNTLVRRADGIHGYNTDYHGFAAMVRKSGVALGGKKVLVLGSGGASATVQAVLTDLGAHPVVISRSGPDHYENLGRHVDAAAIVNTTPVGMYPNVEAAPLSLEGFSGLEAVLDVVYNPARTVLLLDAERRGIPAENGLYMLVAQARKAAEYFTDTVLSTELEGKIYETLARQMENIVLIGMPGCGKSTVGRLVAQALNRAFVDADRAFAQRWGRTPAEVIRAEGEETFRRMESQILADLCKAAGTVIATGGGCVTRPENYAHLHRNSRIFWLRRDVEKLPTIGRPLSQRNTPAQLYRQREPLYREFADEIVDNDGSIQATADFIVAQYR